MLSNNGTLQYYPTGVNTYPSSCTNSYQPYTMHTLSAASMKSCKDDTIRLYDDQEVLITVVKLVPGMVVQFV